MRVLTAIAFTNLFSLATAGSGAFMKACVWFAGEATTGDRSVSFTVGGGADQCMNYKGNDAKVLANKKGTTCVDLGYVEATNSGMCHFKKSIWTVSYSVNQFSGSAQTKWEEYWQKNYCTLQSESGGTNICSAAANCESKSIEWDGSTQGPIYVGIPKKISSSSNC
ncbi:hypothetical protein TWF694_005157 [Orbilia ellipsospora]|uniref:Secreted protein n=1 Tax=Orbilia ellipsospora TaxID=2528407 RepID=A0AAV9WW50_9PEZI